MEYKNSINENELEVKVMPLEAKTLSTSVAMVGKGGSSPFGADSILEKVEANILRKPFTKPELDKLIKEGLDGKTANDISKEMVAEMEEYVDNKIVSERERIEDETKERIRHAGDTIKGKTEEERKAKYESRLEEIETARQAHLVIMENRMEGIKSITRGRLSFFKVGRPMLIPTSSNVAGGVTNYSKGVFLGFEIKKQC